MAVPYEDIIASARERYAIYYLVLTVNFRNNGSVSYGVALSRMKDDEMVHIHDCEEDLEVLINEMIRRSDFENGRLVLEDYRPPTMMLIEHDSDTPVEDDEIPF